MKGVSARSSAWEIYRSLKVRGKKRAPRHRPNGINAPFTGVDMKLGTVIGEARIIGRTSNDRHRARRYTCECVRCNELFDRTGRHLRQCVKLGLTPRCDACTKEVRRAYS